MTNEQIDILYQELLFYISSLNEFSEEWKALIIILPCLLIDIENIDRKELIYLRKESLIIERLQEGYKFGYIKNKMRPFYLLLKSFITNQPTYIPNFKKYINSNIICFDGLNRYINNRQWNTKTNEKFYISSLRYLFVNQINQTKNHISDTTIYLTSKNIVNIILNSNKNYLRKRWNIEKVMYLESKLSLSLNNALIRERQCQDKLSHTTKKVYLGTLFNPFSRIIAIVMQKRNNLVVGFDHGSGTALTTLSSFTHIETSLCNEFITLGEGYVELLNDYKNKHTKLLQNLNTKVYSSAYIDKSSIHNINHKKIKNIIYLATYLGDDTNIPSLAPPSEHMVWKIHVLQAMSRMKEYKSFIKEHPDTSLDNQTQICLLNELQIELIKININEILIEENLLIIDYPQTTCLRLAVERSIPTILLIREDCDIPEYVITKLKKYSFLRIVNINYTNSSITRKLIKESIISLEEKNIILKGDLFQ